MNCAGILCLEGNGCSGRRPHNGLRDLAGHKTTSLTAFNAVKSGGRSGKGDARLCHTPDKVILSICVAHEVNNLKEGIRNHVSIN